jgi:hypothetical protein
VKELEKQCESLKIKFIVVTEERIRIVGNVDELICVMTGYKKENYIFNEKIRELADFLSDSKNGARGFR